MRRLALAEAALVFALSGVLLAVAGVGSGGKGDPSLGSLGIGMTALSAVIGAVKDEPISGWYPSLQSLAAGLAFSAAAMRDRELGLLGLALYLAAWAVKQWREWRERLH